MNERSIEITTQDGVMPVFVASPETPGPLPLVILYMDFWGVRGELRDVARRIASQGYCCALPDLYYRQGTVRIERRDAGGRMKSWHLLDAADRERVLEPLRRLTDDMAMDDTDALLRHLASDAAVRRGPIGCIGYCLGGRLVVRAGARHPDRIVAMASLHPTTLVTEGPDSPHQLISRLRGEIYFGLAELDRHSPPSMIATVRETLTRSEVEGRIEVHSGIDHGYSLPDRDIYDREASERDWASILAMLHRRLNPAAESRSPSPP
jgi:carboxymethylenebutenolidase